MRLYIMIVIILMSCSNQQQNIDRKSVISSENEIEDKDKLENKYLSYEAFLDSITKKIASVIEVRDVITKTDTVYHKYEKGFQRISEIPFEDKLIRRVKTFYESEKYYETGFSTDRCSSFFMVDGNKYLEIEGKCWQSFDFSKGKYIKYKDHTFVYGVGFPSTHCMGSTCRVITYPLFVLDPNKENNFIFFVNEDDVSGLRYGDLNNDGHLDFLKIDHHLDDQVRQIMKDRKIEGSQFYKINIITYRQGEWNELSDNQGKKYYITLLLKNPLNPSGEFEIISHHWLNDL